MAFDYAAGYYPNFFTAEAVKRDIETMKKCGINRVRTGELFNGWDQIEVEKGHFDFTILDEFFNLCEENGIKIILGTGTASPPHWLKEIYPDVQIINSEGLAFPTNITYSWACFHNPGYLKESELYIKTLIERYKKHPALYAYQIHNEIGIPFMSPSGKVEMYCYCEHTLAAFRHWLKNKYSNLEALNHAWTWSATNPIYTNWDQVEPPYSKPTAWSSMTRYLDFRKFMMESITGFVKWQNDIIKTMDQKHPTSTNTFFMKGEDKLGVMCAIEPFELAKAVDIIGYDLYPGSSNKHEGRPEFSSMFLDHARSAAQSLDHFYWLMEVESGPINGWALGPHRNTDGNDIRRYIMDALSHDAKMTLYQGFRQWDFQPLNWGGLVDLDGNETERSDAAAEVGRFCHEQSDFLQNAKSGKGEVAILLSSENAIIANGMGHEEFLVQSIRAHYRLFWEMGFQIDFVSPELVKNGYADDYKIITAPFLLSVDEALSEALKHYVENGGLLIGEPRLGYVDGKGWYNHSWPGAGLDSVFGTKALGIKSNCTPKITYKKKNYGGCWHKEQVLVSDGEVLAKFYDDLPAVVKKEHGKGMGLYFGTHAFRAFLESDSYLAWDVLEKELRKKGIEPELQIDYTNRENREIEGHFLHGASESMLIITSYLRDGRQGFFGKKGKHIAVKFSKRGRIKSIINLRNQKKIEFQENGNEGQFEYDLMPYEYPAFKIHYREVESE